MDGGRRQEEARDMAYFLAPRVATVRRRGPWGARRRPEPSGNLSGLKVPMGRR